MFEGTFVTTFFLRFMSLFEEKTVRAIKAMIKKAIKLNTSASLITKGFLRFIVLAPKLEKPLFISVHTTRTESAASILSYSFDIISLHKLAVFDFGNDHLCDPVTFSYLISAVDTTLCIDR